MLNSKQKGGAIETNGPTHLEYREDACSGFTMTDIAFD